jgi:hypothetical protein
MGLNRQNAMFYDVLIALQRRKDAAKAVADETLLLKKLVGSTVRDGQPAPVTESNNGTSSCSSTVSSAPCAESAVLRIDLKKNGGQVVLFKDQWIRTPMGDAMILSILPKEEKIVLQLSFGKMYANLRRAVCWGKADSSFQLLELSSDEVLRHRWTALQSSFTMTAEVSRGIKSLVGQSDDEAVTDKDDDNSNDDSSPTDNTAEDQTSSNSVDVSSVQNSSVATDRQDGVQESGPSINGTSAPPPITDSSSSSISSFPLKGFSRFATATAPSSTSSTTLSRQALRLVCTSNSASESILSQQRDTARMLPTIFAPPGNLPYSLRSLLCLIYFIMLEIVSLIVFIILIAIPPLCAACLPHLMEKSQAMEIPELSFCQHALTGGPLTGTVGSLAWEGDVIEMSR